LEGGKWKGFWIYFPFACYGLGGFPQLWGLDKILGGSGRGGFLGQTGATICRPSRADGPSAGSWQWGHPRVDKTAQIGRDRSVTLAAMRAQTIPEYLEEERQKASDSQLRTEEEAARIQPLQHGHHRMAKKSKLELLAPAKASTKKKKKRTTAAVTRKKPRTAAKTPAKKRSRR